ncbi:serine carboxypeptidase II-2-like [Tasmannia lanceolata]|uniref:serine carboxypeptidase II-2-like n=1 Tax=Tasmannia lanceolata TaxID=3420 RepID=UPI004063D779
MERKESWVLGLALFFLLEIQSVNCFYSDPTAQQEEDRVLDLPGKPFNVSFDHYSGYVTVNKESGRTLFYWFFEAVEDPSSKPLVLWLNGGPGCSAIGLGEAEEVGPFHVKTDGKTLYLNPYSWNQAANLLFIDTPVGVGYSYSNNSQDVLSNGDERTAKDTLVFLEMWLERFSQYKGRDFYITGESYAGHYIPQLAQAILRSQKLRGESSINLKGCMIGNALTDDFHFYLGISQYMWTVGLISDETYKLVSVFCNFQSAVHPSTDCQKIMDIVTEEIGNIDRYSIFTPPCTGNGGFSNRQLKTSNSVGRISEKYDPCARNHSAIYFNLPEVQKALHIDPSVAPAKWLPCSDVVNKNWKDSPLSMLPLYHELIVSGLRIWLFSGDTDTVIPVPSTRYSIDALKLPTVTPWHTWYDNGEVGGWTQEYKGLTFVTVRGAGHEVPRHKPRLALVILKAFLSGSPMPVLSESDDS